jgi:antitoxin ParD1/3/4
LSGRCNNLSEVVRSGLRLLKEQEEQKATFEAMLKDVRRETKRKGAHTVDEMVREMEAIIDTAR